MNGASYTNDFSTILRVSRTAALSEELAQGDGDGTEPLPERLAKSRLLVTNAQIAAAGNGSRKEERTAGQSTTLLLSDSASISRI
jgi:hypothetical protein